MADVFISYSSTDEDEANKIVEAIEQQGITCWISWRDIPSGKVFPKEIVSAIDECRVFVLLISPESQKSEHVLRELHMASNYKKVIVPYVLRLCKKEQAFEYYLDNIQSILASQNGLQELIRAICSQLNIQVELKVPDSVDVEETTEIDEDDIVRCPLCSSSDLYEREYEYTFAGKLENYSYNTVVHTLLLFTIFFWFISYGSTDIYAKNSAYMTFESVLEQMANGFLHGLQITEIRYALGLCFACQFVAILISFWFGLFCEYRRKINKRKHITVAYYKCWNCDHKFKVVRSEKPPRYRNKLINFLLERK